jgi:hypothetical protein
MKTIVVTLAVGLLLVVNWPADAFQTRPKPHKVKKHKPRKHHLF